MPKTPSPKATKPKPPYTLTKGKKRGLLAQSGQATLENIVALQQQGLKANGKAFNTTKKYDETTAAGRKWLALYVGEKKEGRKTKGKEAKQMSAESDSESSDGDSDFEDDPDPMASNAAEFNQAKDGDASFNFDAPEYRHAFDAIPTEHSPEMLSLYLVYKIYGQGRKIGTADTIHAAFKYMWKMR
jgi:hypothetical protein